MWRAHPLQQPGEDNSSGQAHNTGRLRNWGRHNLLGPHIPLVDTLQAHKPEVGALAGLVGWHAQIRVPCTNFPDSAGSPWEKGKVLYPQNGGTSGPWLKPPTAGSHYSRPEQAPKSSKPRHNRLKFTNQAEPEEPVDWVVCAQTKLWEFPDDRSNQAWRSNGSSGPFGKVYPSDALPIFSLVPSKLS